MNPHIQRARAAMEVKRWEVAQQALVEALSQDPDNGMLHALRAETFYREENYEEARAAARDTIAAEPDWSYGYYYLAWSIISDTPLTPAALDRAVAAADEALERGPDDPDNYSLRAEIAWLDNDVAEAAAYCESGLALDPEHTHLALIAARTLVELRRYEEADLRIREVLHREPNLPQAHATLARIALLRERYDDAYEHSATALRNNPEHGEARDLHLAATRQLHPIAGALLRYPKLWQRILPVLWVAMIGFLFTLILAPFGDVTRVIGAIGTVVILAIAAVGTVGKFLAVFAAETVITFSRRMTRLDPKWRAERLRYALRLLIALVPAVAVYILWLALIALVRWIEF